LSKTIGGAVVVVLVIEIGGRAHEFALARIKFKANRRSHERKNKFFGLRGFTYFGYDQGTKKDARQSSNASASDLWKRRVI